MNEWGGGTLLQITLLEKRHAGGNPLLSLRFAFECGRVRPHTVGMGWIYRDIKLPRRLHPRGALFQCFNLHFALLLFCIFCCLSQTRIRNRAGSVGNGSRCNLLGLYCNRFRFSFSSCNNFSYQLCGRTYYVMMTSTQYICPHPMWVPILTS